MSRDNYDVVSEYIERRRGLLNDVLDVIDRVLRKERDEGEAHTPIYSVKGRVKSPGSAFLKLNQYDNSGVKHQKVSDLPDILGLRVYCLAESHMDRVHPRLLDLIGLAPGIQLTSINIYSNFNNDRRNSFLLEFDKRLDGLLYDHHLVRDERQEQISRIYTYSDGGEFNISEVERPNGYSSIHYLFKIVDAEALLEGHGLSADVNADIAEANNVNIEIQLRTVLQDVWAEIEHEMVYKNASSSPLLPKLFKGFSETIINANHQIEVISEISEKDSAWYGFVDDGLNFSYLHYDESLHIDAMFEEAGAFEKYAEYLKNVQDIRDSSYDDRKKLLNDCDDSLDVLEGMLAQTEYESKSYFFDMERAYLALYNGASSFDEVKAVYEKYTQRRANAFEGMATSDEEKYAAYYRIGEIEYNLGNIDQAIVNFDQCERVINEVAAHVGNKFFLYMKLANMYWSHGDKYLFHALHYIDKAEDLFLRNKKEIKDLNKYSEISLYNNLCWYALDDIACKSEDPDPDIDIYEPYRKAKNYYEKLESIMSDMPREETWSNWYDTAAWYNYVSAVIIPPIHQTSQGEIGEYFEKAKKYCDLLKNYNFINKSVNVLKSSDFQRGHIQTIVMAYNKYKSGEVVTPA